MSYESTNVWLSISNYLATALVARTDIEFRKSWNVAIIPKKLAMMESISAGEKTFVLANYTDQDYLLDGSTVINLSAWTNLAFYTTEDEAWRECREIVDVLGDALRDTNKSYKEIDLYNYYTGAVYSATGATTGRKIRVSPSNEWSRSAEPDRNFIRFSRYYLATWDFPC